MGPTIDCTVTIGAASWDMPMAHTPDTPVDDTMDVAGDTVATYLGVDGTPVTVGASFTAAAIWNGETLVNVVII